MLTYVQLSKVNKVCESLWRYQRWQGHKLALVNHRIALGGEKASIFKSV